MMQDTVVNDVLVSTVVEMPEAVHSMLRMYLDVHPEWDADSAIVAAVSQWLGQGAA